MSMSKYDIARSCIGDELDSIVKDENQYLKIMRMVDTLYDDCEMISQLKAEIELLKQK